MPLKWSGFVLKRNWPDQQLQQYYYSQMFTTPSVGHWRQPTCTSVNRLEAKVVLANFSYHAGALVAKQTLHSRLRPTIT